MKFPWVSIGICEFRDAGSVAQPLVQGLGSSHLKEKPCPKLLLLAGWGALQDTRKAVGLVPGQGENGRQLIDVSLPLSQINKRILERGILLTPPSVLLS